MVAGLTQCSADGSQAAGGQGGVAGHDPVAGTGAAAGACMSSGIKAGAWEVGTWLVASTCTTTQAGCVGQVHWQGQGGLG